MARHMPIVMSSTRRKTSAVRMLAAWVSRLLQQPGSTGDRATEERCRQYSPVQGSPIMAVCDPADFAFDHARDLLVRTRPGELLAMKPVPFESETDDILGTPTDSVPFGPARLGIYTGNGFILHQGNGKLREDPFWLFTNQTFIRPPSYVLDSMTGVDRLYANEPEKVVALARAHLSMPAKDFRCIFSNFMAFAAWCRYYPDVRRNPTDPTKQYKCTRTGWRDIDIVMKSYDTDYLMERIDTKHREKLREFALWQVPDVLIGCVAYRLVTESYVPDIKTFLLGYAAIKMLSMNINNIWHDPAACHNDNNLCETVLGYLFWLNDSFTYAQAPITETAMSKTDEDELPVVNSSGDSSQVYGSTV
ncbi:hypothetical protein LSAT2_015055 [Lamellibrachia satsuma]|nr:hypothetical protein LSAT2_015055 [Lamellibrachia satsuma]